MPEQVEIEVGQVWESKDWRDHGLQKRVVEVRSDGFAIVQGKVRSVVSFRTLRKRYKLVQQALESRE